MMQVTQRPVARDTQPSRIFFCALAALFSALCACSAKDEADASRLTPAEFLFEVSIASCESMAVCPDRFHAVYPSDIAVALSSACSLFEQADTELEEVVARGHTTLDPQAAAECLEALRNCGLADGACELALTGSLGAGAGCVGNEECASGRCEGAQRACGQCAAPRAEPAALGQPCETSVDCAQTDASMVQCLLGAGSSLRVCTAIRKLTDGEACDAPGTVCESGSYCDDRDRTCRPNLPAGAVCSFGRCEKGALCIEVGDTRQCIPVRLREAGESCSPNDFGVSEANTLDTCDPSQHLYCDPNRVCAKLPFVTEGESCAGAKRCAGELFCSESGLCTKPLAAGERCIAQPQCASRRCQDLRCVDALFPSCDAQ